MQNVIHVKLYELLMPSDQFAPEGFHFQEITKTQNVRSSPEHFAIGYVHNKILPRGNIALQYVIQNSCRMVWWCYLMISCTFWRSRKNVSNSTKLSCCLSAVKQKKQKLVNSKLRDA